MISTTATPVGPFVIATDSGSCTDVFKVEISFVEIQMIADPVSGEENIRQSVLVKVFDCHSSPVVSILEIENIDRIIFVMVLAN